MTPLDHLTTELQHCTAYALQDIDRAMLEADGIESFIYTKLTSKKFRKWAADPSSESQAREAIRRSVAEQQPLQFRYPFGGYKLWRMPGSPEVDWAEFFSIAYYCKYLAPIAAVYEPGVVFVFASDDVIIERMDNIPVRDTEAYFQSFKKLLAEFQKYFPDNFKMDIVRIGELYKDKAAMEVELAKNIEQATEAYARTVAAERKKQMYTTSELNIRWDGALDLTHLSEAEKQAMVHKGPIFHDAYCALSKRREFNRGEDKIVLFTTLVPNAIAIGTTKSSITKFWTGFGILEGSGDRYKDRILSPSQLVDYDKLPYKLLDTDVLPLHNFRHIRVY
jgi:hypothetical protein